MATQRCKYLITKILKKSLGESVNSYADVVLCDGANGKCPKKCQPCEINARCWRLG